MPTNYANIKISEEDGSNKFHLKGVEVIDRNKTTITSKLGKFVNNFTPKNLNIEKEPRHFEITCLIQSVDTDDYPTIKSKDTKEKSMRWSLTQWWQNSLNLINNNPHKLKFDGEEFEGIIENIDVVQDVEQRKAGNYQVNIDFKDSVIPFQTP